MKLNSESSSEREHSSESLDVADIFLINENCKNMKLRLKPNLFSIDERCAGRAKVTGTILTE